MRNLDGYAAFFVCSESIRGASVHVVRETTDRQVIAFLAVDGQEEIAYSIRQPGKVFFRIRRQRRPGRGDGYLHDFGGACLDGGDIAFDDGISLGEIGLACGSLASSSSPVRLQLSRNMPPSLSSDTMSYCPMYVWLWQAMKSAFLT